MKYINKLKLNEGFIKGNKLIVVDIQEDYEKFIKFDLYKFAKDLVEFEGDILYLYNGPSLGFEDDTEIIEWLWEMLDYDEAVLEKLEEITFIDKSYGWARDAIDIEIEDEHIIEILRLMIKTDIQNSGDLYINDLRKIKIPFELENSLDSRTLSIELPPFDIDILKKYKGATILGGGKIECLYEVKLLMDAMRIKYKEFKPYIY